MSAQELVGEYLAWITVQALREDSFKRLKICVLFENDAFAITTIQCVVNAVDL